MPDALTAGEGDAGTESTAVVLSVAAAGLAVAPLSVASTEGDAAALPLTEGAPLASAGGVVVGSALPAALPLPDSDTASVGPAEGELPRLALPLALPVSLPEPRPPPPLLPLHCAVALPLGCAEFAAEGEAVVQLLSVAQREALVTVDAEGAAAEAVNAPAVALRGSVPRAEPVAAKPSEAVKKVVEGEGCVDREEMPPPPSLLASDGVGGADTQALPLRVPVLLAAALLLPELLSLAAGGVADAESAELCENEELPDAAAEPAADTEGALLVLAEGQGELES